ncbi:22948_t:CDS:2 [Dentiscutata erythropus]|uniref:22948_t:CDS:1 n=1 Tax=Dentiscutata erythropus TaxID=1348616 RepID=A0A9N8ZKA8_9GLOM|nr:22948_t:CDS:2 [Dentiscutata erythropus]
MAPRTISTLGSISLLVSSMTGPGLVQIPLLFQYAGWFIPLLVFIIATLLSGAATLFLCESLSSQRGNDKFQNKIEFTHFSSMLVINVG